MSPEDFQLGYSMTGLVERSSCKYVNFQTTHLAFVRRNQQQPQHDHQHHILSGSLTQQDTNKSKHLNSFLTNLELTKMLSNTHHSLDNQYHSAYRLKRSLQNDRCDSASSDSSTSTLVEDCIRNADVGQTTHADISHNNSNTTFCQKEQDLILVVPTSISHSNIAEEDKKHSSTSVNKVSSTSNKKCCSVQCIDSMSTASSVCPSCSTPVSDCFTKSPLPFKKEINSITRSRQYEKEGETKELRVKLSSAMHVAILSKPNFPHFIKTPKNGFSPYKDISKETSTKCIKTSSNNVQISANLGAHQLLKSPFKEWLL